MREAAALAPGTVLRHARFYRDRETGAYKPKFLVLLALTRGGDWVVRLLTSQHAHVRPQHPPCHHGDPYPGFHLGVLDPANGLGTHSWLDLRGLEDADADELQRLLADGTVTAVMRLPTSLLRAALDCTANADDTSGAQENALRDQAALL